METTFSRGVMRLITNAIGGGLACLIMWKPVIATNPYYLTILMMVFNFIVGLAVFTEVSSSQGEVNEACKALSKDVGLRM